MNTKEIIKRLQDKTFVRAFGLMEETLPGSQECYRKVGKENCLFYTGNDWEQLKGVDFYNETYAIKPDYKPEPEFLDLEIIEQAGWLGVSRHDKVSHQPFTYIHCLPSLPNFVEFYVIAEDLRPDLIVEIGIDDVAQHIFEGKTVFARFRSA